MAKWSGFGLVDIDNLCEPVFSVIVNRLRWFNGKRANIIWWSASKTQSIESGLKLSLYHTPVNDINLGEVKLTPIFNHIYTGRYPESATDPVFAQWVSKQLQSKKDMANYVVVMRFGNRNLNLGDVSTGKIKHIIDGLYPLVGGMPGRPDDWRISALAVEKGTRNLSPQSISVAVWEAVL